MKSFLFCTGQQVPDNWENCLKYSYDEKVTILFIAPALLRHCSASEKRRINHFYSWWEENLTVPPSMKPGQKSRAARAIE